MSGPVAVEFDKCEPLMDEVVAVRVSGLARAQPVTLRASIAYSGYVYVSWGCFSADEDGAVDLTRCPAELGTYTGVSPMGLFWSMQAAPGQPSGIHLRSSNASMPFCYTIDVFDGHVDFRQDYDTDRPRLCSATIRRWYMAKGVQRVRVTSGRIRGALFLPPGPGPFRGVIDLFGSVGSLVDFRGALLASRGFAVLVLPYIGYDDLPDAIGQLQFEYFMEAAAWLSGQPWVVADGLGVLGISKGGEIALQMAYYSPKIKAVVSINGLPYLTGYGMSYGDKVIGTSELLSEKFHMAEEGLAFKAGFRCSPDNYVPLWEKDVKVLLVAGGDDQCVDSSVFREYLGLFPAHRKHNCELCCYEGAGHLIDPPYSPMFRSTRRRMNLDPIHPDKKESIMILWGGKKVKHAHAQEDSWRRIIEHFNKHLQPTRALPNREDPDQRPESSWIESALYAYGLGKCIISSFKCAQTFYFSCL